MSPFHQSILCNELKKLLGIGIPPYSVFVMGIAFKHFVFINLLLKIFHNFFRKIEHNRIILTITYYISLFIHDKEDVVILRIDSSFRKQLPCWLM